MVEDVWRVVVGSAVRWVLFCDGPLRRISTRAYSLTTYIPFPCIAVLNYRCNWSWSPSRYGRKGSRLPCFFVEVMQRKGLSLCLLSMPLFLSARTTPYEQHMLNKTTHL